MVARRTTTCVQLWQSGSTICVAALLLIASASISTAQPTSKSAPSWIWSPEHETGNVPQSACHFRKTIHFKNQPKAARVEIAADDIYELFVNGKRVGRGSSQDKFNTHNISSFIKKGKNVVAVKVTNRNGSHAGLAARVTVTEKQKDDRLFVTNPTWRTSLKVLPLWNSNTYRDAGWVAARNLGSFGNTAPWSTESQQITTTKKGPKKRQGLLSVVQRETTADGGPSKKTSPDDEHPRFRLPAGFQVQHVVGHAKTGSLIGMAFNEFGQILASQEGGPLLLIYDTNNNDIPDEVRVCCERVKNCQGILAISGNVFVVADGPAGAALYRLDDDNQDGDYESVTAIVRFEGTITEHGPHGIVMGPDAMIYISLGNHTQLKGDFAESSPHKNYYEGHLQNPKYEDPRGHAAGIKAPGGGILRTDFDGQRVELIAGGMRNVYDIAFNQNGDLFAHDSDMESDAGTPWHRPTRLLHVTPGSEFGWRSGSTKWPSYFLDSLPPVLETGRGSPTGSVVYEHNTYPKRYHNALFSCDWAQGEIYAMQLKREGSSYTARREVFLQGRPLNVTDIDIGPDGWIYFTTGGRGTRGNLYRVVWNGKPTKKPKYSGLAAAVRQPQLHSAWGRQRVSTARRDLGERWDRQILSLVFDASAPSLDRIRAMELMHLVGPPPNDAQLVQLAQQKDANVRARAAYYLGMIGNDPALTTLRSLLEDRSAVVRRVACEALARSNAELPLEDLTRLLGSDDRFESWAARRLLEQSNPTKWQEDVLVSDRIRLFVQGSVAILASDPSPVIASRIAKRATELTQGFVPDSDLLDIVRVIQLAISRAELRGQDVPGLQNWLANQFPAKDAMVNRELIRLIVRADIGAHNERVVEYLKSDIDPVDKVHVITQLRFLKSGWTPQRRSDVLAVFQQAKTFEGGKNLERYMNRVSEDFSKELTIEDHDMVLSRADEMPDMAVATMFALPESSDAKIIPRLIELDRRLATRPEEEFNDLRVGIVAILARHGSEDAMGYLREIFDRDPARRQVVAMGLAQKPDGRNWDYLVRSLPLLEGEPARETLSKLAEVDYAPQSPEHFRQVILSGLRLKENGGTLAANLLRHWTGETPPGIGTTWDTQLSAWQRWYDGQFPDQPEADLPQENGQNTWTFDDLITFLDSAEGKAGTPDQGALVYKKAQCADCHAHGGVGSDLGPDLTTLASRFQQSEVVESIVYPSQVISDQYGTKTIMTDDGGTVVGMVVRDEDNQLEVLKMDGKTVTIDKETIEEMSPSRTSSMPEGLLNSLSLEEIADLMAFLMTTPEPEVAERPE